MNPKYKPYLVDRTTQDEYRRISTLMRKVLPYCTDKGMTRYWQKETVLVDDSTCILMTVLGEMIFEDTS